jgi:lysophospholipase L1-like esterase
MDGNPRSEAMTRRPAGTAWSTRAHAVAIALLLGLAACSSKDNNDDGGTGNPNGPSGGSNAVYYSAISASDGTGYGSSSPCLPFADCPNGTGYVQRVVREMRNSGKTVTVLNLSVPGSVVGPEIENLARQLGRGSIGNFVERQLPFVSRSSTLVTIFGGANDVNVVGNGIEAGLGGGNPVGWGTAFATGFGRDLATIVDGVRARAPNAKIILLNPPNGAGLPYVATRPRDQLRILQAISVRFSAEANVQASRGVLVVDLMCDPRSYLPSNYSSDGFHPSDSGYAFMAEAVLAAVNASTLPPPRADCPQMHLAD